jgi:hypothetical protein
MQINHRDRPRDTLLSTPSRKERLQQSKVQWRVMRYDCAPDSAAQIINPLGRRQKAFFRLGWPAEAMLN